MSQAYLIGVVIRLYAVYLFVSALRSAVSYISTGMSLELNRWTIPSIAIPMLAALFMWFFNLSLAKRLFYGGSHERPLDLTGVVHLEQALFSLLGLWLVCSSLSDCGYWLVLLNSSNTAEWAGLEVTSEQKASMFAALVRAVLGVFLMFRAGGLARLIAHFRG